MTKLQVRAFLYQLGGFAILFISLQFLIDKYTHLTGLWIPMTAFVVGTILAPKFQAVKTKDGEKLFMKWLFIKGIKDIT
jgi:fucose permease